MSLQVLHLIDSGGLYGAERMLLGLVQEQLRQGMRPVILSTGEPGQEEKAVEAEARRLSLPLKITRMKPGLNRSATRELLGWIREVGFDIVHTHGFKFNILLAVYGGDRHGISWVSTVHGHVKPHIFRKIWLYERLDRWALRRADHVIFVREGMGQDLGLGKSVLTKSSTIENGLDFDEITFHAPMPTGVKTFLANHQHVICGVGRLSPEKGFDILIRALDQVRSTQPGCGVVILGTGRLKAELERVISAHGLEDHVLLAGYVSDVIPILASSSVVALPSLTEGLPITLLEAMYSETPIVATTVGGMPQVLEHGRLGILVPPNDPKALAKGILEIINTPSAAKNRTRLAVATVKDKFSAQAMGQKYAAVYHKCMGTASTS
ncbi:MAG: glycosyltransferase [Aquisalimonadaceae bacterium]